MSFVPYLLPDPEAFSDWKQWAKALVRSLKFDPDIQTLVAPEANVEDLPDGVTPGVIFWVPNATAVIKLVVSTSTGYRNVYSGGSVA